MCVGGVYRESLLKGSFQCEGGADQDFKEVKGWLSKP
jgi:hypothetical protein